MEAVYLYDRSLTLERELRLLWHPRKLSVATGLYVFVHLTLAVYLLCVSIVASAPGSCQVCANPFHAVID